MPQLFSHRKFFFVFIFTTLVFFGCFGFAENTHAAVVNSATSTSAVKDFGGPSLSMTFSWTASTTASTSVAMQVRSGSTNNPAAETDENWTSWTSVATSGDSLSSTIRNNRYFQYRAILTSQDINYVPALHDVTISRTKYVSGSALISSIYDSGVSSNMIPRVSWTGSGTSSDVTIRFQVRSANSTSTLASSTWCGFEDTGSSCTGSNYFDASENGTQITDTNHPLMSGGDDRYFQYKVVLSSTGTSTATLSSVTVSYVVNAPPEFATSTVAIQQTTDGKVRIDYSAFDSDTEDPSASCQNCVYASFQYSINGGSSWEDIPNQYLSTPDGETQGFATSTISASSTAYAVLWDAKSHINGIYATSTKIKITLNDREGGNNIATSESNVFALDVHSPVAGNPPLVVRAHGAVVNGTQAQLSLSASDEDVEGLEMCITLESDYSNCTYSSYASSSAITLTNDPKRVYVSFRDTYKNTTNISAITPESPDNIVIKDVSVVERSEYQEFIAWKAVASTTFAHYHIEHSSNGSDFTKIATIDDSSINFYFHQDLESGSAHFYRVYTEDTTGNTSFYSDTVQDTADGTGGSNPNPPILTNIATSSVTTQSVTIEWDTNELSDSSVHYSTDKSFETTVGSLSMVQDESHVGKHRVVLTGLTPNQTYYFTVESKNISNISGTNTNEGEGFSFTTLAGPVISDVTATNVTNNSATIVWNTDTLGNSVVYYATSSEAVSFENVGSSDQVTNHQISLSNLERGTLYYYYVVSGVAVDKNGGNYYTFTTPVDNVAPVITSATTTLVTDTNAVIQWTTNELATSQVTYGTESGVYTANSIDENLSTNHKVILSDLATSTKYYFKVISSDASGNEASSTSELFFTTLERLSQESEVLLREAAAEEVGRTAGSTPTVCGGGGYSYSDTAKPILSKIKVTDITGTSAKLSWTTNESANTLVQYGKTTSYNRGQIDTNLTAEHTVFMDDLLPLSTYHYKISSIDASGNVGTSGDMTFSTTDALGNVQESSSENDSEKEGDSTFAQAFGNVASYLVSMANKVSVNVLEESLNSQYNIIRQLSNTVPPPILSGEPRVLTTADTATITWRTDKEANSLVAIASESKFQKEKGSEGYVQVVGNPNEAVTLHTVIISDLEPETVYHYQVRSMTQIGAVGESSDFTFRTKTKELEIGNHTVENLNASTAIFRWVTNNETDAAVKYTPYRNGELQVDAAQTVKDKNFSTLHEVTIDNFESGIVYEVELSGKDMKGKVTSKKISSFSTGDDNYPPTIYQVQTESALSVGKESNVQTIISWLTDEPATSQVFYQKGVGLTDEEKWESTPLDTNYSKKHIVVLTKFEPGQIYQFKIQSADSNNNIGISKVYTILAPRQKESVFQVIMKNFEDVFGWTQGSK